MQVLNGHDKHVAAHEDGPVQGETPMQTAILEVISVQKARITWLTSSPEIAAYPSTISRTDDTSSQVKSTLLSSSVKITVEKGPLKGQDSR